MKTVVWYSAIADMISEDGICFEALIEKKSTEKRKPVSIFMPLL